MSSPGNPQAMPRKSASVCSVKPSAQETRQLAEALAISAGKVIATAREQGFTTEMKGGVEPVTSADFAADALIRKGLQHAMPGVQILSEEGEQADVDWNEPVWVIDPIDGTVNYAYGHDYVTLCLAYVEHGQVQASAVHAPFHGETFTAVRDQGAWRNGKPMTPRNTTELRYALVATGFPYVKDNIEPILDRFARMMRVCRDARRLASAALDICWVACGRLDACYESVNPWDIAAASLIAREAGVRRGQFSEVASMLPQEVSGIDYVFAVPGVFDDLLKVLREP